MSNLGVLYNSIKQQVNELGNGLKQTVQGHLEENNKKEFKDREGNTIQMDKVGISTGVYIPANYQPKDKDWISLADKVALEKAKEMNMPQKNGVAIYWEEKARVVSAGRAKRKWGFGGPEVEEDEETESESESESDSDS